MPAGKAWHALQLEGRPRLLRAASLCWTATILGFVVGSPIVAEGSERASVILISVDTLRADHLGCYGYGALPTPHIDAMRVGATQFLNVNSQVPLTLPSHVSLFTSTYPFSNGVEDNGAVLVQGAVTLASLLKSRGYRTAGFIGGFPLDRRFGFDQGFDFYDSPFNLTSQQNLDQLDLKRPAGEVTQAARQWLQDNSDHPFFLFLHLYDLHKPYSLAPEMRTRFRDREYDGVLSYVDATLGDFWRFLQAKGLVDRSLIIFLSDHGESLGEHGERTHGYFIYESTLRVPLIIHWPRGAGHFPSRADFPTGLIDVAPTILQFLGVPEPPQFQGRSLLDLFDGRTQPAPREVYSESLYAHYHYGCDALRSLRVGDYKYISAPEPELYDLAADPAEQANLYARMPSLDLAYRERLQKLRSSFASAGRSAQPSAVSPDVARALSSLGYVASSGSHAADVDSGPDPKARVDDYLKTEEAVTLSFAGRLPQSVELLKGVLSKDPELIDTRNLLALFEQKLGRREEAAEDFRKVLERDSANLMAHYNLGVQYFELGRLDDAARELEATLTIASPRGAAVEQLTQPSEEMLGKIWLEKRDVVRARNQYNHLLTVFPRDFAAHYNLGWIAAEEKNWEEATRQLRAALEIEPNNARAHNALGTIYLEQGDFAQASVEFGEAIRLDPKFAQAHYDLGMTLSKMHKRDEAAREFKKALEVDPKFLAAQKALDDMR
jgi:arylsulfatase A-like enzyme/Tfp pilus assembly protein PilF